MRLNKTTSSGLTNNDYLLQVVSLSTGRWMAAAPHKELVLLKREIPQPLLAVR